MNRLAFSIIASVFLFTSTAHAVDTKIMTNCAADYFKYCAGVWLDTKSLTKCLKDNGSKISKPCLNSLVTTDAIPIETVAVKEVEVTPEPEKTTDDIGQKIRDKIKAGVAGVDRGLTELGNKVSKIAEPITKNFKPDPKVAIAYEKKKAAKKKAAKASKKSGVKKKKKSKKNNFKEQDSGKWKGYPLRLEWRDDLRTVGGEITPYGYRDRIR